LAVIIENRQQRGKEISRQLRLGDWQSERAREREREREIGCIRNTQQEIIELVDRTMIGRIMTAEVDTWVAKLMTDVTMRVATTDWAEDDCKDAT